MPLRELSSCSSSSQEAVFTLAPGAHAVSASLSNSATYLHAGPSLSHTLSGSIEAPASSTSSIKASLSSEAVGRASLNSIMPKAPTFHETDWEAIKKFLQLSLELLSKRKVSDLLSVMTDPTVAPRIMREHVRAYSDGLQATSQSVWDNPTIHDARILGNAARAAAFSCAVYGSAMKEGLLSGVAAFVGGAAAENLGHWTNAQHVAAFRSLALVEPQDLLFAHWKELTFEPAFCVARARERGWLVLAVRGSIDWRSLLTDATAHATPIAEGYTHEGMLRAARSVLDRALPLLRTFLAEHPDDELVCVGHSLGGGTAALAALLLREGEYDKEGDPVALRQATAYGIGTPPLLSAELAERCRHFIFTVVQGMDFVSRLSVFAIDQLLYELTELSAARRAVRWIKKALGKEDGRNTHFERTFGPDCFVAQVMVTPGRILHIDTVQQRLECPGSVLPRAHWGASQFYYRYFLGLSMFRDHLPEDYHKRISLLAAAMESRLGAISPVQNRAQEQVMQSTQEPAAKPAAQLSEQPAESMSADMPLPAKSAAEPATAIAPAVLIEIEGKASAAF